MAYKISRNIAVLSSVDTAMLSNQDMTFLELLCQDLTPGAPFTNIVD